MHDDRSMMSYELLVYRSYYVVRYYGSHAKVYSRENHLIQFDLNYSSYL